MVKLNKNDHIKEVIWLDPEILPNPLPLNLSLPSQITQKQKKSLRVEKEEKKKGQEKSLSLILQKVLFIRTDFFFFLNQFLYSIYLLLASIIASLIVKQ